MEISLLIIGNPYFSNVSEIHNNTNHWVIVNFAGGERSYVDHYAFCHAGCHTYTGLFLHEKLVVGNI
jgi:hypothetical protein